MAWDSEWDEVVDVVCTDAGIAGLCGAIAAVDADADVFLAAPTASPAAWFPAVTGTADPETMAYLRSLTEDIDLGRVSQLDADLPTRTVVELGPPGKTVPPFFGSRLRNWAIRTIGSPTGYLYTRLTDWRTTTVATTGGEHLQVVEMLELPSGVPDPLVAVHDELAAQARSRRIRRHDVARCEALVLEGGVVVGAVFADGSGRPLAVRAEHGVFVCGPPPAAGGSIGDRAGEGSAHVGMVSKAGSRFGRVEVLTREPADT